MKCLSVCQPFADLIVSGRKTIELRGWSTRYRGHVLVHAPIMVRWDDCARLGITDPVTGAILGRVTLADVKRYESADEVRQDALLHLAGRDFETKRYGFVLQDPIPFRFPIAQKGRLGLFEVEPHDMDSDSLVRDIMEDNHRYRLVGHH